MVRWKKLVINFIFVLSFLVPAAVYASTYGSGTYGNCAYGSDCEIAITTTGGVTLDTTPSSAGSYTINNDSVVVTTNSASGYTLSLSNASSTEAGLINDTHKINSHIGTTATPTDLAMNTWGFRVDSLDGFGVGPTSSVSDQSSNSLTFAGVPLMGSGVLIKSDGLSVPTGEQTNVWYGVRVNNTMPSGQYSATVTYTAVAK